MAKGKEPGEEFKELTHNPEKSERWAVARFFNWVFEPNHPFRQMLVVVALIVTLVVGASQIYELIVNGEDTGPDKKDENPDDVIDSPDVDWKLSGFQYVPAARTRNQADGPKFFRADAARYEDANEAFKRECGEFDRLSRRQKIICESQMWAMTSMVQAYSTLTYLICNAQADIDDFARTNNLADWRSDIEMVNARSQALARSLQYTYHQFNTTKLGFSDKHFSGDKTPVEIFSVFFKHAEELRRGVAAGLHISGSRSARLSDDFHDRRDQVSIMQNAVSKPLRKLCASVIHGVS